MFISEEDNVMSLNEAFQAMNTLVGAKTFEEQRSILEAKARFKCM